MKRDAMDVARKYGYSIRGLPLVVISMEGVHDVYLHQGSMNGDSFTSFVEQCLYTTFQLA